MEPVARNPEALIEAFRPFTGRVLHLHLETTAGAYTAGGFGAFARNLPVHIERLSLRGTGPFRIGAETGEGFIYAEGITHWEVDAEGRLNLEGHDDQGRLTVCFELSPSLLPLGGTARVLPRTVPPICDPDPARRPAPPTPERSVLVSVAHPDDETFGWGGTLALYALAGVPVTSVQFTLGQMGRNLGLSGQATRETLQVRRERELRAACDALGIGDLWLLGIWDKTTEFRDLDLLADRIEPVLREVRPSLVLTQHPVYGGHPDHCTAGRATLRALLRLPREERPHVWVGIPRRLVGDVDARAIQRNVEAGLEAKEAAIRAHHSQSEAMLKHQAESPEEAARRRSFMLHETYLEDPDLEALPH